MPNYSKLALSATNNLIEGNRDIIIAEEVGFAFNSDIFVDNQYMILLKNAFENIGLFDKERRQKLITLYNKVVGDYNYTDKINVPISDFTIEPDNIEILVGETVNIHVICSPENTTDADKVAIYNPSSRVCSIKQIGVINNNIAHFTVTGKDNGTSKLEITGGKTLKNLNVVVNY